MKGLESRAVYDPNVLALVAAAGKQGAAGYGQTFPKKMMKLSISVSLVRLSV
jgi:hypothetical protein